MTIPGPIKVLLIEDNPGDAELIRTMLAEAKRMTFDLEWHDTLAAGMNRLSSGGIDLVLLDLVLPDSAGLETLRRLIAVSHGEQVVVVLSGQADEEIAFQALQQGAQDYLIKGRVDSRVLARRSGMRWNGVRHWRHCAGRVLSWKNACKNERKSWSRPTKPFATASICWKESWTIRMR